MCIQSKDLITDLVNEVGFAIDARALNININGRRFHFAAIWVRCSAFRQFLNCSSFFFLFVDYHYCCSHILSFECLMLNCSENGHCLPSCVSVCIWFLFIHCACIREILYIYVEIVYASSVILLEHMLWLSHTLNKKQLLIECLISDRLLDSTPFQILDIEKILYISEFIRNSIGQFSVVNLGQSCFDCVFFFCLMGLTVSR